MPVKFFGQAFSINPFQYFGYRPFYVFGKQVVDKPIFLVIWGLGRSPKQGEGGSPTFSPFPRGRGLGIGIENLLYFYKYRFFYKLGKQAYPYR